MIRGNLMTFNFELKAIQLCCRKQLKRQPIYLNKSPSISYETKCTKFQRLRLLDKMGVVNHVVSFVVY